MHKNLIPYMKWKEKEKKTKYKYYSHVESTRSFVATLNNMLRTSMAPWRSNFGLHVVLVLLGFGSQIG